VNRASRAVLHCYPPSFRARYGEELDGLVAELPPSARTALDLAVGALRAWVTPRLAGPDRTRSRMQASVATTWVAWCVGFLIAPTMAKSLLDPLAPGTPASVPLLVGIGSVAFVVGWLAVGVGVVTVLAGGVVSAAKRSPRRMLGPLLAPLVLGVLAVGGVLVLSAVVKSGYAVAWAAWTALAVWAAVTVAFLIALGVGGAVGLRRARLSPEALRPATALAPIVAVCLVVATGTGVAAAILAGNGTLLGSAVPMVLALAVAGLAAVVAMVSSTRGLGAIHSGRAG
jgi:hypothetical protein